ncbi:MAG: hypothetical protein IID36_07275 [Planctomycetes bacterium]|nr:hypothetical protein [Planctomycetota bacterium]
MKTIISKLVEWGRNPDLLAEDDLIAPTPEAIERAIKIAEHLEVDGSPPPMRVVPDGDGGIVLEHSCGSVTTSIEIASDGSAECVECVDGRVVRCDEYHVGQ